MPAPGVSPAGGNYRTRQSARSTLSALGAKHHAVTWQPCEGVSGQETQPRILPRGAEDVVVDPGIQRREIDPAGSPHDLARDLRTHLQLIEGRIGDDRLVQAR